MIEDDPEIRDLLELLFTNDGHQVLGASDGHVAISLVTSRAFIPDVIVADFNLPNGMDGIEAIADLRAIIGSDVPAIILTGDISTLALTHIGLQDCLHFTKPIRALDLTRAVDALLAKRLPPAGGPPPSSETPTDPAHTSLIYVVDDDPEVREAMQLVIEQAGNTVVAFASAESFLAAYTPGRPSCLVVDAYLPGMSGIDLVNRLNADGAQLPAIMITGSSDVSMAVAVMKAGAIDFIEKPVSAPDLLAADQAGPRTGPGCICCHSMARPGNGADRRPDQTAAPDHGSCPRGPSQQEYRCRPQAEPAHR